MTRAGCSAGSRSSRQTGSSTTCARSGCRSRGGSAAVVSDPVRSRESPLTSIPGKSVVSMRRAYHSGQAGIFSQALSPVTGPRFTVGTEPDRYLAQRSFSSAGSTSRERSAGGRSPSIVITNVVEFMRLSDPCVLLTWPIIARKNFDP